MRLGRAGGKFGFLTALSWRRILGRDPCHDSRRICRRVPDLLHEGSFRRRILHNWHSVVAPRDGPGDRRWTSRAIVHRDGSVRVALLEALDMVETGSCAAIAGTADRHRSRLSVVPRSGPPRHSDRDRDDYADLCRPMACWGRGGDDPPAFLAE